MLIDFQADYNLTDICDDMSQFYRNIKSKHQTGPMEIYKHKATWPRAVSSILLKRVMQRMKEF